MSLRTRLAAIMIGLVVAALAIAWGISGHVILEPFVREVLDAYLDEVVFAVEEVEAGGDPGRLGERLGLSIERRAEAPTAVGRHPRRHGCLSRRHRGRDLLACRSPRATVGVRSGDDWIVVERGLDLWDRDARLGRYLFLVLIGVGAVGLWLGATATRPLRTARDAMRRVAAGDLEQRLPTTGPKELVEAAHAFNAMTARVKQMLATERSLMAGISHELRTPLARLRLQTELSRDLGATPERLDAMDVNLEEIDALIGELLEISRFALGERPLDLGPVELRAVAEAAVARAAATEHPVHVEGEAAVLEGDAERLIRVVANLVQNAIKYTPAGAAIEVRIEDGAVSVCDHGPGVPEAALPRLFEPFYRVGGGATAGGKSGVGLGLMIARQIIELHGGRIEARNRAEGGLEVRFELPIPGRTRTSEG